MSIFGKSCELCGDGNIRLMTDWIDFTYRGHGTRLLSYSYHCNVCECDYVDAEYINVNKSFVDKFKASVDNLEG